MGAFVGVANILNSVKIHGINNAKIATVYIMYTRTFYVSNIWNDFIVE